MIFYVSTQLSYPEVPSIVLNTKWVWNNIVYLSLKSFIQPSMEEEAKETAGERKEWLPQCPLSGLYQPSKLSVRPGPKISRFMYTGRK